MLGRIVWESEVNHGSLEQEMVEYIEGSGVEMDLLPGRPAELYPQPPGDANQNTARCASCHATPAPSPRRSHVGAILCKEILQ
jgi:hypothetical protein